MKKIPNSISGWKAHLVFKYLFVTAGLLISFIASAQQQSVATTVNSPDLFIEKNPESPLVKFYLADPTNARAFTAIEYSVMLNDDQQIYKDEQGMRNFITDVTTDALKFEKYSQQGVDSKIAMKRVSSQPTITPASEQIGNSKPQSITKTKTQTNEQPDPRTRMQVVPVRTKTANN